MCLEPFSSSLGAKQKIGGPVVVDAHADSEMLVVKINISRGKKIEEKKVTSLLYIFKF